MKTLKALSDEQVDVQTKEIFNNIKQKVGRVPNLYAAFGNSPILLEGFLQFSETLQKGVFSAKEREAIDLAVSQTNHCGYCISAHTALAKMAGFSEEETLQLRDGTIADSKLRALTTIAKEITENRGKTTSATFEQFFAAGYNSTAFVELIGMIALRSIANYVFNNGDFEIDFPKAKNIEELVAF